MAKTIDIKEDDAALCGGGAHRYFFCPPEDFFAKKVWTPQKIRGQWGDKREKVKMLKYLFTISYRLFPISCAGNSKPEQSLLITRESILFRVHRGLFAGTAE